MKKFCTLFILVFLCSFSSRISAQTTSDPKPVVMDTLITLKNEKIVGKITKVTETEFEYKKSLEPDAPIYTISREKIKEIRWGNGSKELVMPDEMSVNKEHEILDKRSDIQFHFFSIVTEKLSFTYEHVIKVGINLEVTAGLINNTMIKQPITGSSNDLLTQGAMLGAGVKFLLGQDFYLNGMKYAHPLKGRYIKPEILYAGFIEHGVVSGYSVANGSNYGQQVVTDLKVNSVAIMLNYGRQFVLGNILTFGYSVGVGYSLNSAAYSNPGPSVTQGNYISYNNGNNEVPTYLYTHDHDGPLAFNCNLTLGYIFK